MLGGQTGTPGRSCFHYLPVASLQGGQGLSDAWTARMFICEPQLLLRGSWECIALFPLTALTHPWASVAIIQCLKNCQILGKKDN